MDIRLEDWVGKSVRRDPATKQKLDVRRSDVQRIYADDLFVGVFYVKTKRVCLHYRCTADDMAEVKAAVERLTSGDVAGVSIPPDISKLKEDDVSDDDFDS